MVQSARHDDVSCALQHGHGAGMQRVRGKDPGYSIQAHAMAARNAVSSGRRSFMAQLLYACASRNFSAIVKPRPGRSGMAIMPS